MHLQEQKLRMRNGVRRDSLIANELHGINLVSTIGREKHLLFLALAGLAQDYLALVA